MSCYNCQKFFPSLTNCIGAFERRTVADLGPIFFIFLQFSVKYGGHFLFWEILDSPLPSLNFVRHLSISYSLLATNIQTSSELASCEYIPIA